MATHGIRIRWDNPNGWEDGVRIYRSETSFDKDNLPPLLIELPRGSTSYIDESANAEATYFYLVSMFYGSTEVFSQHVVEASAYAGPLAIGEFYQGGYYIGNITVPSGAGEGVYAVIMAGKESEASLQWKTARTATDNATSTTDGRANTDAMIAAGIELHPAAEWCVNYTLDGYNDWYLPAKDELHLAYTNRAGLGALELASSTHWSSTQYNASNAWNENMSNGSQHYYKTSAYLVRPVRRIRIS